MTFVLDPRLAAATVALGETELSLVRMMDDRSYPWIVLVPQRPNLVEWCDLGGADRHRLIDEATALAERMAERFGAEKMNVATLGNRVRQFHLHVIARKSGDPAWPDAVWNGTAALPYEPTERAAMEARLRDCLSGLP